MKTFKQLKIQLQENALLEGSTDATAEKYEVAIIMGLYSLLGKEKLSKTDIKNSRLQERDIDFVMKNKKMRDSGKKIADSLVHQLKKKPSPENVLHSGRISEPLTEFWKDHGGSNTTPKSDLIIDRYQISLKMGPGQLMSGGKGESLATFYAALDDVGDKMISDPRIKEIEKMLGHLVGRSATASKGTVGELLKAGKDSTLKKADAVHKKSQKLLRDVFAENEKFQVSFSREAMSGFYKFGRESLAAATHILTAEQSGSIKSFNIVTSDVYCAKIASQTQVFVRFKSQSEKKSGTKTGKYNYWSVVNLIQRKEKSQMESFLKDNGMQINEGVFDDILAFLTKVWEYIKNVFNKGMEAILDFFDLEIENVGFNNEINW